MFADLKKKKKINLNNQYLLIVTFLGESISIEGMGALGGVAYWWKEAIRPPAFWSTFIVVVSMWFCLI